MQNSFAATGILRTSRADGAMPDETLDVEFCDARGRVSVVRVTPDMAATLARTLGDFASQGTRGSDQALTKVPASFGVGTGRFDDVVLVRFEDDTPYALGPAEATALGEALIDQAELVGARPVRVRQ